jgi:hypothetical protein
LYKRAVLAEDREGTAGASVTSRRSRRSASARAGLFMLPGAPTASPQREIAGRVFTALREGVDRWKRKD